MYNRRINREEVYRVTFDQIDYFMSCASCLNFSLAAKYHYVSVSTLSRNISALEEELGVKLFQRGYHGHTLTKEGIRFFDFAEAACRELDDFWIFVDNNKDRQSGGELLRIACYPFDNMFGEVVECFSKLPPDYLGKKYKIKFIAPGTMIECIRSGRANMGVAAAADLEQYKDEFSFIPFFNSRYSLRVKDDDPMTALSDISLDAIFDMGLKYSDFLPIDLIPEVAEDKILASEKDLEIIGWISQKHAAELIWHRQEEMDGKYYLLPKTMEIPYLQRRILPISGSNCAMEFVFFQKKSDNNISQSKIEQLKDHLIRNMKIQ